MNLLRFLKSLIFRPPPTLDPEVEARVAAIRKAIEESWPLAQSLEREDRLEEAEEVLQAADDSIDVLSRLGRLYEERCARKAAEGDDAAARDAARRVAWWLDYYAASATSGGEGTANSNERDRRQAALAEWLPDRTLP